MKKTLFIIGCSVLALVACKPRSMDQGTGSQSGQNSANQTGAGGTTEGAGSGATATPTSGTNQPTNSVTPTTP